MRVCKNYLVLKSTQTIGSPSSQVCLKIILLLYNIKLNRGSGLSVLLLLLLLLLLLYAVSWWGIELLGSCFGFIVFLFPMEVAGGQFCGNRGNLVRAVVCFVPATAILKSKWQ